MRINVYAEEITPETSLEVKTVTDDEFGERTFYGMRMYLESPEVLHHSKDDDDRSAITLWVKWTRRDGTDVASVRAVLEGLLMQLDKISEVAVA